MTNFGRATINSYIKYKWAVWGYGSEAIKVGLTHKEMKQIVDADSTGELYGCPFIDGAVHLEKDMYRVPDDWSKYKMDTDEAID